MEWVIKSEMSISNTIHTYPYYYFFNLVSKLKPNFSVVDPNQKPKVRMPLRSVHFVGVINKDDGKKSSKLRAKDAEDLYLKIQFKKLTDGKVVDSDAVSTILFTYANVSILLLL